MHPQILLEHAVMYSPFIKICGIKSPELAYQTAIAGADFIGIIFHPNSRRNVPVEKAKAIATAAKQTNATPVAVFVDQSARQMHEICLATDIEVIQLHGSTARAQHHLLPTDYQRFYVRSVSTNGTVDHDAERGLLYCDPKRDYLLFDNAKAGNGQPFNWDQFRYDEEFRLAFAGGLTANNVALALKKFKPDVVDVSSGVENLSGEKDIVLIQNFIRSVHLYRQEVSNDS